MMSKLYYTDPLAAAYMAREFGVLFNFGKVIADDAKVILYEYLERRRQYTHYYIHPDSLSIFEPQENDLVRVYIKGASYTYVTVVLEPLEAAPHGCSIIQRNGKPFFMPEVENE